MMTRDKVIRYLSAYVADIIAFEGELMKVYNLDEIPFNELGRVPKAGVVFAGKKEMKYHFHGNGCTFIYDNVKVGYSIYTDRKNYIATAPFEFMEFINSFDKDMSDMAIAEKDSLEYLSILEEEGFVSRIFKEFYVYEINMELYKGTHG